MTLRTAVAYLLLAEAFAVTTFGLGWWSVPAVAALYSALSKHRHRARVAAVAAIIGWAGLLLIDATRGPVGVLAAQLASVMGVPTAMLLVLTLLFPGLLAWSAASIVPRLRRAASPDEKPAPIAVPD